MKRNAPQQQQYDEDETSVSSKRIKHNHVEHIPDEVLWSILDFIDDQCHLIQDASLVNKQWLQCVRSPLLWQNRLVNLKCTNNDDDETTTEHVIQFIKACNITRLHFNHVEQVNHIIPRFQSVLTEISLCYLEEVHKINCSQLVSFPELKTISFGLNTDLIKKWLPFMPNLNVLETLAYKEWYEINEDEKALIQSLDQLRKFNGYALVLNSDFIVDMFNELKHLEESKIRTDSSIEIDEGDEIFVMWDDILSNDEFCNRLKVLEIECDTYEPLVFDNTLVGYYNLPNLRVLNINGSFGQHTPVLFARHELLEVLTLHGPARNASIDLSSVRLPNLKSLKVFSMTITNVVQLLLSCNSTIEELECRMIDSPQEVVPVVDLPRLKSLTLEVIPIALIFVVLQNNMGKCLRSIYINQLRAQNPRDEVTDSDLLATSKLFHNLSSVTKLSVVLPLFRVLPTSCINNVREIQLIVHGEELDNSILEKLLECSELRYIGGWNSFRKIVADNWLVRLLSACPKLQEIDMPFAEFCNKLDVTTMTIHQLSVLKVHRTNLVQEYEPHLFTRLPNLYRLECWHDLDHFSYLIQCIDSCASIQEITIFLHNRDKCQLKECHFMQRRTTHTAIHLSDVTLEEALLILICSTWQSYHRRISTVRFNPEFLPDDYKNVSEITKDVLKEAILHVLPDVVKRIQGITEDERQDILNQCMNQKEQHAILRAIYTSFDLTHQE